MIDGEEIVIREPSDPRDYRELMDVQLRIWGMPDYSEAVTYHALIAAHRNGGVVIGAYRSRDQRAVGLVYSFPGCSSGQLYLYSHLTGVVPEYRYKGLGYLLKQAQRILALRRGYQLVKWTFDPLRSSNAYFNIVKLGVVIREFYPNYYGELLDEINRGMPSDRFIAEWWISSPRVEQILNNELRPSLKPHELSELRPTHAIEVDHSSGYPRITSYTLDHSRETVLVEIPDNIEVLRKEKPGELLKWRMVLREIFNYYLNNMGYIIIGYVYEKGEPGRGYYILWKRTLDKILEGELPWS